MGERKGGKQMKRRIDKNKVYAFAGRAVTKLSLIVLANIAVYNLAIVVLDNCITVYR